MKLIKTEEAVGHVLCHDITQIIKGVTKDALFRKGHIVTEEDIPDEKIREVIDKTGYTVTGITRKPYEKKGFFARFKKSE